MKMLKCNFEVALYIAIQTLKKSEGDAYGKDYKSAFLSGLESALKASQKGEVITIDQD